MKMEIEVTSTCVGRVREIRCVEGRTVQPGQIVLIVEPS
jgi:biotin carboxyl carrier protein